VLLDTHIFFWFVSKPSRLSVTHQALIADRTRPMFVSAVSAWEISVKVKLGKWPEAVALLPSMRASVVRAGLQTLDITFEQAELAGSLDLIHRDPFDRLLAAQALSLDLPIVTVDPALQRLGCKVV
jgi:PIN domain nuclease of toxin-antitoxin system